MNGRTVEVTPTRALSPMEYSLLTRIVEYAGCSPSGMIENKSQVDQAAVGAPIYLFYGESNADINEDAARIRDRIFAQIATYFRVLVTNAEGSATAWVRHKKLVYST